MNNPKQILSSTGCSQAPGASQKILYAEDNEPLRELSVRSLRAAGYSIVSVADGLAAYDALRADPFDLLITDNDMPRLTGFDLISRLRLQGFDLPIIVTSGETPLTNTPADRLGISYCLQKPFEIGELLAIVRQIFNQPFTPAPIPFRLSSLQLAVQPRHWGLNE